MIMDLPKLLLFLLSSIVFVFGYIGTFSEQFRQFKELVVHYVWLFLYKFLPRRRFVLERLPKHVSFSIADYYEIRTEDGNLSTTPVVSDLARLVFWCGRYGVEKVSIYDWMGVVADHKTTKALLDSVWSHIMDSEDGIQDLNLVVNGIPYDKRSDQLDRHKSMENGVVANGHSRIYEPRTLELTILDWKCGRRAIVQASRTFGADIKAGRVYDDASKLGTALNDYLAKEHNITPPDLLIEFGGDHVGDSSCGYPPLALRVMEIVRIARHRGISELTFLDCLEKYSKRDRRFGK